MPDRFWPLGAGRVVTSGFGARWGTTHWGTDFGRNGGAGGMPVYAAQGGSVVNAGPASGFGRWVVIDHPTEAGSGATVYGHIVPEVRVGQRVMPGQRIAHIDPDSSTNGGVAPHLHFEVHRDVWRPPGPGRLDPLPWLAGAAEPGQAPPKEATVTPAFGIDVSNHQGAFNFAAAAAEGFAFATHKITEGDGYRDPQWPRAKAEMAKHFPGRWGGYVFCRTNTDPRAEARTLAAHAGSTDFPLQIDYEDTTNGGSLPDLQRRIDAYLDAGFVNLLPIYLPRWYWQSRMGSPDLTCLPVGIWNSHYVGGTGYASALYQGIGESHPGWAPMGGQRIDILQFSETASVAGQRIDVNAVRGGASRVAELFGGKDDDMTPEQATQLAEVHRELTQRYPSRSAHRENDDPVDTLAGIALNTDGRVHEASIDVPAKLDRILEALDKIATKLEGGAK